MALPIEPTPITPSQEKIADMLVDMSVTIEKALSKDEARKLVAQVNSIVAYLDIVHEDMQRLQEIEKVPREMMDFLANTKRDMQAASSPSRLASMSQSRGIDMEAYNQGCYDTIDRFIKNFQTVIAEIEAKYL